ncbi:hypothetical protein Q8A67_000175 [Cirrhinus molitorella]|uniref:Uncharacterized protein n=1 Tax=Cirrhinus molitorella TaxID=172907 RepID=A0AA88Q9A0_9TELE|nr:hypothetical protein Q8A67_000175 [Cirrhinus molitorella]
MELTALFAGDVELKREWMKPALVPVHVSLRKRCCWGKGLEQCNLHPHLPLSPLYADSGCPLTQRIVPLSCTEGNWHKHTPAANNAALILLKDAAAAWITHTSAI